MSSLDSVTEAGVSLIIPGCSEGGSAGSPAVMAGLSRDLGRWRAVRSDKFLLKRHLEDCNSVERVLKLPYG